MNEDGLTNPSLLKIKSGLLGNLEDHLEMNSHMPQSIQSMNELMDLTAIPYNIIGPKDGKPVIGIVQDTLLGVFRITKDSIRVKDKVMANLQMVNSYFDVMPPLKAGEVSYTGRQVYSQILPPGLFLESSNKNGKVSIRDGQLVAGNLDKSSYNSMSKGLTPVVFHDYGPFEARRLLDNTQRLICRWLMTDGFSVGISDLVVDEDVSQIMSSTISTMKQQVYDKINAVRSGRMESHPLYSNQDYFEIQIGGILNESTGNLSKAALSKINDTTNRMINMIKSGSKGSDINVAQMVGCLGQQNVDSKRIAYGFTDRTLPHYTKFDDGPEARGFVESNFIGGLSPQEVFFHAMGGREGLIDTAVKSVTGETTIVILENDIPKYVKIGDWIDAHLAADAEDVAHFEERQMELLYIKNKVFIPTTDYDGKVTWGEVTAVTRHDPGTELYEIKTEGGRSVIVTESKSLLIWQQDIEQFKEVLTPTIKVGDCVPVTGRLVDVELPVSEAWSTAMQGAEIGRQIAEGRLDHVPVEALIAPVEFVQGLIDGCTVFSFKNERLATDMAMIFSRVGVYTKINGSELVVCPGNEMQMHNDVVLDPIVSIRVIDLTTDEGKAAYPKVYDLTIPSTLNFGLANGLQVRDTSETGYLQRRLVKAMEDCKIYYDYTVRNASGVIVQFLYGEDGMEGTKIENQFLPHIQMNLLDMENTYLLRKEDNLELHLTPTAFKSLRESPKWADDCRTHFQQLLDDREFIITKVFKNDINDSITFPIPFGRIVNTAFHRLEALGLTSQPSDLTPAYILSAIERLSEQLYVAQKGAKELPFLYILLRLHLSPKVMIFKHHINVAVFDWICSEIVRCFKEAVAQPGEMVGIIAAQSIGEPATQLSMQFDTRISLVGEENFTGKIGEFIDRLLSENPEKVINLGGDSVVMDLEKDYNIIGVSDTEKSGWRRISQISRHPANGQLMTVTTRSGRKTTATLSHSFLKRITDRIIPVEGSKLKVGDRIPVARKIPTVVRPSTVAQIQNKPMNLDKQFGWIVGAYLADGYVNGNNVGISKMHSLFETNIREFQERYPEIIDEVSVRRSNGTMSYIRNNKSVDGEKERVSKVYESKSTFMKGKGFAEFMLANFGTGSNNKRIPAWVYASNIEFIRGVVSGYFDGDGNTNGAKASIRVHSVNEGMIDDFIILLAYCGVFCTKLLESKKNKLGNEDGREQDLQVLLVSRKYARHFRDTIGFQTDYKAEGLDQIIEYNDREDRATSQEMVDKIPELGSTIAYIGKMLELPGQSRNYGRWRKKESIGRDTLAKFIEIFKAENAKPGKSFPCVATQIRILEQAVNSDVVWDEIVQIDYLDDPKEYVYDFTVPGNDSFMVDAGVLVHNTLNSVEWPTKMLMKIDGKLETLKIGEYIDKMMVTIDPKDIEDHPHDTKLGWIRNHKVEVLACTEDGKIIWDNVQAVTRHPVVNKDGTNTLLKVTLRSGREVVATKAKSFLKKVGNKILAVDGDVLKVGDHIPISKVLPVGEEIDTFDGIALTAEAGAAMGASLGDTFPTELLTAPKAYLEALVTGFFSARAAMKPSLDVLEAMQQVLVRLGVQSEIDAQTYTLSKIETSAYDIIPEIELSTGLSKAVPREQLASLAASASPEDLQVLEAIQAEEVMYDEIIKIEEIVSQHPYVYDLTVEHTKNFNTYSGIAMRDTFHLSGTSAASKATRGVPRLKELLSVSKNIKAPSLQIYLQPAISENKDRSTEALNRLEICRLVNILDYTEIYWDPPGATGLDTGITDDKDMLAVYRAFAEAQPNRPPSTSPWVLRLGLNKEKMFRAGVTMLDIYMKILNNYGHTVECMFSDDNTENLVFRIRMYDILASNKEFKDIDQDDAAAGLKAVEWNLVNHMLLKGMTKINKVSMREQKIEKYIPDLKEFAIKAEWILDTDGSNLLEILADQNVDGTRTISNDIWEIYQVLGIEAARAALYNEIHEVIRESSVNFRHIALLIDTMTSRGALMPIDRHGINRGDVGPLAKSSFEETTEMLIKASIFGEYDRINGVSANIMLGQMPPCGTGDSEILLDEVRYMELLRELPKKTKIGPRGPGAAAAAPPEDIPSCSAGVIGFSYNLPEKRTGLAAPKVVLVG